MNRNPFPLIVVGILAVAAAIAGAYVAFRSPPSTSPVTENLPPPEVPTAEPSPTPTSPPPESPTPRSQPMQVPSPSPDASPPPTENVEPVVVTPPPPDNCEVNTAIVSDPNPPTNVRSTPEVAPDNIVGTLANGTYVSLSDRQNGWFKITTPVDGWISQNLTETTCASVSKRINFPPNGTSAIVKGRIIGGGSHEYILNASEGQTMTVTVIEGALPFIFPPNDPNRQRDLTGGGHYTGKERWTGTLPATGDYLLQLDSNFRGFEYELLVSVQ